MSEKNLKENENQQKTNESRAKMLAHFTAVSSVVKNVPKPKNTKPIQNNNNNNNQEGS